MSPDAPSGSGGGSGWGNQNWRRRGWGPPGRPPWWPEGEAWPPVGPQPWRRIRRRFFWRAGLFAVAVLLLIGLLMAAVIGMVAGATEHLGPPRFFGFFWLVLFLGLILLALRGLRGVGRVAVDVGDLIEAAGRIEAGEYGVQVRERGPSDLRTLVRSFNAMSARLAATDRNRRAFVADLSHEFRTPLAVIRGQAEGIADGIYTADQAHIAPILDATQSLETLVDALGTMTLADVGGLRLHREAVEVGVLINSTVAAFQAIADGAGVTLSSQITTDTPPIDADPVRIRSVLMNLLSNAIRYTPSGGSVVVAAQRTADSVTISVRDTGPGIPDDLRDHVFERFVKGPGSPGAGLGLAISRDVVTAHGGSIELTSEVGKGTEVRVTLPIA